ncbi:MAG: hypothetical protein JWO91_1898, partial [Acidobacteriaceae bacterium]|nr:hypothetical protein [Acidobacteriaceae bacterium]
KCTVSNPLYNYEKLTSSHSTTLDQRLTDRIKELCARAVALPESPELNEVLAELNAALREHTRRLRNMALGAPISRQAVEVLTRGYRWKVAFRFSPVSLNRVSVRHSAGYPKEGDPNLGARLTMVRHRLMESETSSPMFIGINSPARRIDVPNNPCVKQRPLRNYSQSATRLRLLCLCR